MRRGLSRVEVIVTTIIMVLLLTLALPALQRQRESSRRMTCENNLKNIGLAFFTHADLDETGRLTTGLPDWQYDGCPDTSGWIATARSMWNDAEYPAELDRPSEQSLTCPSNNAVVCETMEAIIGQPGALITSELGLGNNDIAGAIGRHAAGRCSQLQIDIDGDGTPDTGTLAPGSPERVAVAKSLVDAGYSSNYAASWLLTRTGYRREELASGDVVIPAGLSSRHKAATYRCLTIRTLDQAPTPTAMLPLLGDASASQRRLPAMAQAGLVRPAQPAATTMTATPAYYNAKRDILVAMPPGTIMVPWNYADGTDDPDVRKHRPYCEDVAPTPQNPAGHSGMDGKLWLIDTRGWRAVHNGQLALLMADGSVEWFDDRNGDGLLNPGFPVKENSQTDYADATLELYAPNIYTLGEMRASYMSKGTFE